MTILLAVCVRIDASRRKYGHRKSIMSPTNFQEIRCVFFKLRKTNGHCMSPRVFCRLHFDMLMRLPKFASFILLFRQRISSRCVCARFRRTALSLTALIYTMRTRGRRRRRRMNKSSRRSGRGCLGLSSPAASSGETRPRAFRPPSSAVR